MPNLPHRTRFVRVYTVALLALLLVACHWGSSPTQDDAVVNVYNWFDYIQPALLQEFTQRTGIQVRYTTFDSDDTMAARLLTGHSGFDVAFPSGAYLQSLIQANGFLPLDKSQLPNLVNMDTQIMQRLALHDPENAHAVDYAWGITGFAYDEAKIRARLPNAPTDSWSMLFDPKVAAKFADCGIGLYESPHIIFPSVLAWLGLNPSSEDPADLQRAEAALLAVRPYIRKITDGSLVDDLASGQLCLIIASNGDAMQVQERVRIAANGEQARYTLPKEGAVMWMDVAAIPADAPHPANALRLINFLMDAQVAARNSNAIHFPNGNAASQSLLDPALRNATLLPDSARSAHLIPERPASEDYVRLRTRAWTHFRTGQ